MQKEMSGLGLHEKSSAKLWLIQKNSDSPSNTSSSSEYLNEQINK